MFCNFQYVSLLPSCLGLFLSILFFAAIINRIVFLISFLVCSMLAQLIFVCVTTLYPVTLLNILKGVSFFFFCLFVFVFVKS